MDEELDAEYARAGGIEDGHDRYSEADKDDAQGDKKPFRPDYVEKFAPGQLRQQAGRSANAQNKSDLFLRPALIAEDHGHERPEAGQDRRDKEIDGVESPQALSRRRGLYNEPL